MNRKKQQSFNSSKHCNCARETTRQGRSGQTNSINITTTTTKNKNPAKAVALAFSNLNKKRGKLRPHDKNRHNKQGSTATRKNERKKIIRGMKFGGTRGQWRQRFPKMPLPALKHRKLAQPTQVEPFTQSTIFYPFSAPA